jgi:hypothetical protein
MSSLQIPTQSLFKPKTACELQYVLSTAVKKDQKIETLRNKKRFFIAFTRSTRKRQLGIDLVLLKKNLTSLLLVFPFITLCLSLRKKNLKL